MQKFVIAASPVICNGASRELLPRPRRVEAACFFGICDATPGLEQTLSNMCCKCGPYDRMSAKHTRMLCFMQFLVHTITGVALVHDFLNHTETLCEGLSRIRMSIGVVILVESMCRMGFLEIFQQVDLASEFGSGLTSVDAVGLSYSRSCFKIIFGNIRIVFGNLR